VRECGTGCQGLFGDCEIAQILDNSPGKGISGEGAGGAGKYRKGNEEDGGTGRRDKLDLRSLEHREGVGKGAEEGKVQEKGKTSSIPTTYKVAFTINIFVLLITFSALGMLALYIRRQYRQSKEAEGRYGRYLPGVSEEGRSMGLGRGGRCSSRARRAGILMRATSH